MKPGSISPRQHEFPFSKDAFTGVLCHYLAMMACAQGGRVIANESISLP